MLMLKVKTGIVIPLNRLSCVIRLVRFVTELSCHILPAEFRAIKNATF